MNKRNNPIQVVENRLIDHKDISGRPRRMDNKVFDEGASPEKRQDLANQTDLTIKAFEQDFKNWPNVPAVAKVTLKEDALAKSHRPKELFSNTTCPIIGTLGLGEILISATPKGLSSLKQKILTNDSKKPIANISAIEKIEAYSQSERVDSSVFVELNESNHQKRSLKIKIFDHYDDVKNTLLKKAFVNYAEKNNISYRELEYGKMKDLFVVDNVETETVKILSNFIGLRSITFMPIFQPLDFNLQAQIVGLANKDIFPHPMPDVDYPIVGIIDSGICPNNEFLTPWVVARESFVPAGEENYTHGTMVAGLVVNSKTINHNDIRFPDSQAKIVDINVFPKKGGIKEEDLIAIIEEVVPKYPNVKVWNLSLGASNPVKETDFSDFACFLDEMHDKHNCLFVIAAGNQNNNLNWPTLNNTLAFKNNRISAPADSIRALTVGSIANRHTTNTMVTSEQVSPFSRVGPGPCFIPKPEVTHYGGNICENGMYNQTGILSTGPNNTICESIGTSFAAPIISSISAQLHHFLSKNNTIQVSPEKIKALLIHSALLSNQNKVTSSTLPYYGFGKPTDLLDTLYCDPHCITMLFEVEIRHGLYEFEKYPFPIPSCLKTSEGKFKGDILMTLVYSPSTNKQFASEYCRINVDAAMGKYDITDKKTQKRKFNKSVWNIPEDGYSLYEKSQIKNGLKWSPVKAYYRKFPNGIDIESWRLKLKVERRAEESIPDDPQRATLVLTLRALDPNLPVYNDAIQEMNRQGWIITGIDQHLRIQN